MSGYGQGYGSHGGYNGQTQQIYPQATNYNNYNAGPSQYTPQQNYQPQTPQQQQQVSQYQPQQHQAQQSYGYGGQQQQQQQQYQYQQQQQVQQVQAQGQGQGQGQGVNPYQQNNQQLQQGNQPPQFGYSSKLPDTQPPVRADQSVLRMAVQVPEPRQDDDKTYGPLGRAREAIERGMKMDEEVTVDLKNAVVAQNERPAYGMPPDRNRLYAPLQTVRDYSLPSALHEQIKTVSSPAKMGLFELIDRAWFTLDKSLYLWDYNNNDGGFQRYDSQDSTIQCVALSPVRANVLIDEIQYALIICTATDATIFGVTRKGNDVDVYSTNLKAALSRPFTTIVSTNSGRLVALADDGDLYELHYGVSQSSWIPGSSSSTVASVTKRTGSTSWIIFPGARSPGADYVRVTADPAREHIFAQKRNGGLDMFEWDGAGQWTKVGSTVFGVINQILETGKDSQIPASVKEIVHIAPVRVEQSADLVLVAIAGFGNRYYLSRSNFLTPSSAVLTQSIDYVAQNAAQNFGQYSFYTTGLFIGVPATDQAFSDSRLRVYSASTACRSVVRENCGPRDLNVSPTTDENDQQEWISILDMPGQVWTIAEMPDTSPARYPHYLRGNTQWQLGVSNVNVAMGSLVTQTRRRKRRFAILSMTTLRIVEMQDPVDAFASDLDADKRQAIPAAWNAFGKVQVAAMGVLIGSADAFQHADLGSALQTLINESGPPSSVQHNNTMYFSHRHEGLVLQFARFLRPIWTIKVVNSSRPPQYILNGSQTELQTVQANLQGLSRYLADMSYEGGHVYAEDQKAWHAENSSVAELRLLVKQAIEAISFVLLLSDYKLAEILANPKTRQTFLSLSWNQFLTHPDGRECAKELVQSLIESQIGQQTSIDTLSEVLQQRCGSFCQTGDVVKYKAEEALRRAEGTRNPSECREQLEESLGLYRKAAVNLDNATVSDVCGRYRKLGFVAGAVDLPLYLALERDPDQRAEDYKREGARPNDPRRAEWELRQFYYSLVVFALGELDEAQQHAQGTGSTDTATAKAQEGYERAIHSDDELFHFYLYEWNIKRGNQDMLLNIDSPYIEAYLQQTENSRDLLWRFYSKRGQSLSAARVLHDLASQDIDVDLNQRQVYLSQAIVEARSANVMGTDDVQFVTSLEETKDVADVQLEVLHALEARCDVDADEKHRAVNALALRLKTLDELYMDYARPYRLYESILLIIKTANTPLTDVCHAVWTQLVQDAIQLAHQRNMPVNTLVGERITELLRRFYPSEAATVDVLVAVVYAETYGEPGAPGWTTRAMVDGGLGLRDLWDTLMGEYDTTVDAERAWYAEELGFLAERWISNRDQIPAAEIDRMAGGYLLDTSGSDDRRVMATRQRFQQAKSAIGR